MQKTIEICGKEVLIKTNGLVPLIYKKEFKRDYFSDVHETTKDGYDIELLYNLLWTYAKTADSNIPSLYEWLEGFEALPITKYIKDIIELTTFCITTKKPLQKKTKKQAKE